LLRVCTVALRSKSITLVDGLGIPYMDEIFSLEKDIPLRKVYFLLRKIFCSENLSGSSCARLWERRHHKKVLTG